MPPRLLIIRLFTVLMNEFNFALVHVTFKYFLLPVSYVLSLNIATSYIPANIYLFKVNNRNTKKKVWNMFKVNNNNTRKTSLTSLWYFFVNFEHISHLFSNVSIGGLEQISVSWNTVTEPKLGQSIARKAK